jgi:hypothetical protein
MRSFCHILKFVGSHNASPASQHNPYRQISDYIMITESQQALALKLSIGALKFLRVADKEIGVYGSLDYKRPRSHKFDGGQTYT